MLDMMSLLICARCKGEVSRDGATIRCAGCGGEYPILDGVPQFDLPNTQSAPSSAAESAGGDRDVRRTYWDRGWQARFQSDHSFLNSLHSREEWRSFLEEQIVMLRQEGHVSVVEASGEAIKGKLLLDIGCGAGAVGAMFGYCGARYIGVDHSAHAAAFSLRHLRDSGGEGFTLQANAEALPLLSNSIDVVYSNGVLHHTPNFHAAMDEAYRVLKPGGRAIIALYATYSTQFGVLRLLGLLKGKFSRRAMDHWMGEASEGAWRTEGRMNPWTETFSAAQLRRIASGYGARDVLIRKSGHPIGEIPRIGPRLMRSSWARRLDESLKPLLGDMLIISFTK